MTSLNKERKWVIQMTMKRLLGYWIEKRVEMYLAEYNI